MFFAVTAISLEVLATSTDSALDARNKAVKFHKLDDPDFLIVVEALKECADTSPTLTQWKTLKACGQIVWRGQESLAQSLTTENNRAKADQG